MNTVSRMRIFGQAAISRILEAFVASHFCLLDPGIAVTWCR